MHTLCSWGNDTYGQRKLLIWLLLALIHTFFSLLSDAFVWHALTKSFLILPPTLALVITLLSRFNSNLLTSPLWGDCVLNVFVWYIPLSGRLSFLWLSTIYTLTLSNLLFHKAKKLNKHYPLGKDWQHAHTHTSSLWTFVCVVIWIDSFVFSSNNILSSLLPMHRGLLQCRIAHHSFIFLFSRRPQFHSSEYGANAAGMNEVGCRR